MEELIEELDNLNVLTSLDPAQKARKKELEKSIASLKAAEEAAKNVGVIEQAKLPITEEYAMFLSSEIRVGANGSAVILQFMTVESEVVEITTSEGFWKRVSSVATEEKPYCRFKAYRQKSGQRIRISDGSIVDVKRDSLNLQGITRIPEVVWNKVVLGQQVSAKQREEQLSKDIDTISALDKSSVDTGAIASLMRAARYGV